MMMMNSLLLREHRPLTNSLCPACLLMDCVSKMYMHAVSKTTTNNERQHICRIVFKVDTHLVTLCRARCYFRIEGGHALLFSVDQAMLRTNNATMAEMLRNEANILVHVSA